MTLVCGVCGLESVLYSHAGCMSDAGECALSHAQETARDRLAAIAGRVFADCGAIALEFYPSHSPATEELDASTECRVAVVFYDDNGRVAVMDIDGDATDGETRESCTAVGPDGALVAMAIESHVIGTAYAQDALACVGNGGRVLLNREDGETDGPELDALAAWSPDPDAAARKTELIALATAYGAAARRATAPKHVTVEELLAVDVWVAGRAWFEGLSETDRDVIFVGTADAADALLEDIRDAAMMTGDCGPALLAMLVSREELEHIAALAERCGDAWLRSSLQAVDSVAATLAFPACELPWHDGLSATWADEPGAWWAELWASRSEAGAELADVLAMADAWETIANVATAAIDGSKRPN